MPLLPIPAHVKLGYWAIAAGIVGKPVNIIFQDYPPLIVAEVFNRYATSVGLQHVLFLHDERHLRLLEQSLADPEEHSVPRAVFLTHGKLLKQSSWLQRFGHSSFHCGRTTPSLLASQCPMGGDELPGPTLTLHGSSPQLETVSQWVENGLCLDELPEHHNPDKVDFSKIDYCHELSLSNQGTQPLQYRDKQVLNGLLAGAAFLRRAKANSLCPAPTTAKEDYSEIFEPLRLLSIQASASEFDPLSLFMVQRANVYMELASRTKSEEVDQVGIQRAEPAGQITRRELADLGHTQGPRVRQLLHRLLAMGDAGLKRFKALGTIRRLKEEDSWPASDSETLAHMLIQWSAKQVRTKFDRLLAEGFITGARSCANQPWKYELPEALKSPESPFRSLPHPDTLIAPLPAPECPDPRADETAS